MSERLQLKVGISELNFGYNAKMKGYTNSSSDIPKLYAISPLIIGSHRMVRRQ